MRLARLLALLLATAAVALPATDEQDDSTTILGAVLLDQQARARGLTPRVDDPGHNDPGNDKPGLLAPKNALILPDRGNIAVVDDGQGVGLPAFLFDLDGQAIDYLPQQAEASSYLYRVLDGGFDADAVAAGEFVELGDDDFMPIELPFDFPFFGRTYRQTLLHSDGNFTFGRPDAASTPRDAIRAVSGPPRICAFFTDLDPTRDGAAIRVFQAPERVTVSWINTPEWVRAGGGRLLTFQATLYRDGRIRVAYSGIEVNEGVIGLASGENLPQSVAIDFSQPPVEPFSAAFVEIFTPPDINLSALMRKYYLSHDDAYDFVVIFHDYEIPLEGAGFAFYAAVRNYVRGVGPLPAGFEDQNILDFGAALDSPFRLQGLIYMGELDKYPDDPAQRIAREEGVSVNTTLSILAHEAGHRFLSRILLLDRDSEEYSFDLLGRQLAHWSFFFNSEGSFLEGAKIVDHGPGASPFRFETTETFRRFGPLDLYLLGLVGPEQVPPSFYVRNPDILGPSFHPERQPRGGVIFDGERVDVRVEDLIETMGPRSPGHTVSQKHYRYGFILLTEEGSEPSAETIAKMERIRQAFGPFMREQTGGGWVAETELVKGLTLNTWPAHGRLQSDPVQAAVFLDDRADEDLTVTFSAPEGLRVPASAVIPRGAFGALFPLEGRDPGDYLLEARIDERFDTARSSIRILGATRTLGVERLFPFETLIGDPRERLRTGRVGQPLPLPFLVRVTDPDGLSYEGIPVRMTPSGDGSVSPQQGFTDGFGTVLLDWTLASTPGRNTLKIEVVGADRSPIELEAYGTIVPERQRNRRRLVLE